LAGGSEVFVISVRTVITIICPNVDTRLVADRSPIPDQSVMLSLLRRERNYMVSVALKQGCDPAWSDFFPSRPELVPYSRSQLHLKRASVDLVIYHLLSRRMYCGRYKSVTYVILSVAELHFLRKEFLKGDADVFHLCPIRICYG
jgi:hypothetical protein